MVVVEVVVMVAVEVEVMDPQVEPRQNKLGAACLEAPGTLALEVEQEVEGRRASGPSTES